MEPPVGPGSAGACGWLGVVWAGAGGLLMVQDGLISVGSTALTDVGSDSMTGTLAGLVPNVT